MQRLVQTGYRSNQSERIEEIDLEAQRREKPPKPHPIETQNPVLQYIFYWVRDIISTAATTTWNQEMNYDLCGGRTKLSKPRSLSKNLSKRTKAS